MTLALCLLFKTLHDLANASRMHTQNSPDIFAAHFRSEGLKNEYVLEQMRDGIKLGLDSAVFVSVLHLVLPFYMFGDSTYSIHVTADDFTNLLLCHPCCRK